jgi:Lar family restriction alleviation protein
MTDTTHEAPDLLPCPFCGGEAKFYHRPDDSGWSNTDWVSCAGDCGASTCMHETKEEAIAAWNTRSDDLIKERSDEVQAAVAAALREAAVNLCTYAPHLEDGPEHDVGYYYGYHTALNRILALLAAVESRSILGQHDGTLPDDLMEQIEATIREGSNERSEEGK